MIIVLYYYTCLSYPDTQRSHTELIPMLHSGESEVCNLRKLVKAKKLWREEGKSGYPKRKDVLTF